MGGFSNLQQYIQGIEPGTAYIMGNENKSVNIWIIQKCVLALCHVLLKPVHGHGDFDIGSFQLCEIINDVGSILVVK